VLSPQTVTLEDLFFSLTEGTDGADGVPVAEPASASASASTSASVEAR
jgi:hypothetical protein